MTKVIKNLSLDAAAVRRGERYSARHRTNLSRLVSDLLVSLPVESTADELSPIVRRLRGIAVGSSKRASKAVDEQAYHAYLLKKYGHS